MQQRPLLTYFVLAFAGTWLCFAPVAFAQRGLGLLPVALPDAATFLLYFLATYTGPFFAAFMVTRLVDGADGVKRLLRRIVQWRMRFEEAPGVLVEFVVLFSLVGVAEEFGWRGYALPRLQGQYSALVASLILGVVWAVWHLPLFFNPGTSYSQRPFAVWLVFLLPYAVLHSWLYNSSRGSLLLSIALHAMVNATGNLWMAVPDVGPVAQSTPGVVAHLYLLSAAVQWTLAVVVVLVTGPLNLSRRPRQVAASTTTGSREY